MVPGPKCLRFWKVGIINNTAGLRCRLLPTCTCYCCSLLPLQCTAPGLDPAPASSPCPCPLSSHLPLCPRNKFRGLAFSRVLLQEKPSPVLLSRHHTNTGLLSSATCTPPRTTPTPPPPIPRAPAAPRTTAPPRPAPVPCPARPALLLASAPSPPSSATRQRPPVLVLRCCPRPPRRHLAARNTKGTGARPQPRTTPPPRPAPAPCPARLALLLSFAPSPSRASARAPSCDAPVPCQCPALRRCGHARPAVTCNSAKQRARQSPRPPPHHHTPPHAAPRQRPTVPCQCPTPAPLRPRTPHRHLQQGKRPALRRCGLARPIINLQQGKAGSTERQLGGERARKQA